MASLKAFFKANKKTRPNVKFVVSEGFTDDAGKALEWELTPLTSVKNNKIMESCYYDKRTGVGKQTEQRFNQIAYQTRMAAASVVYPDLADAELQNSYGATNKTDLLVAMLDAAEMSGLSAKIAEISGFDAEEQDDQFNADVESAKNL